MNDDDVVKLEYPWQQHRMFRVNVVPVDFDPDHVDGKWEVRMLLAVPDANDYDSNGRCIGEICKDGNEFYDSDQVEASSIEDAIEKTIYSYFCNEWE